MGYRKWYVGSCTRTTNTVLVAYSSHLHNYHQDAEVDPPCPSCGPRCPGICLYWRVWCSWYVGRFWRNPHVWRFWIPVPWLLRYAWYTRLRLRLRLRLRQRIRVLLEVNHASRHLDQTTTDLTNGYSIFLT